MSRDKSPEKLTIETEREADGRWIAEIPEQPGVMAYGKTREEAVANVAALARRVAADWLNTDATPDWHLPIIEQRLAPLRRKPQACLAVEEVIDEVFPELG